ncbi:hypothetical protein EDD22DRAFT_850523 [Suillus occidentalis]|nr:hypothetical protein EDD22DRAFT_850523 [Suillus occidentalis]
MGRPRLYNSPEEQAKAARMYRLKYYGRNREQFRLKNKEHYLRRKKRTEDQVNDSDDGPGLGPPEHSKTHAKNNINVGLPNGPQKRLCRNKSAASHITPASRTSIKSRLATFLGGPDVVIHDYLDVICLTLLGRTDDTLGTEDICSSVNTLQELEKHARAEEAGILQRYGVGPKLVQAQGIGKEVHHLLSALEEVFVYSLSGIAELADITTVFLSGQDILSYLRKLETEELKVQTSVQLIVALPHCLSFMRTAVNIQLNRHPRMAPRSKFTTEQCEMMEEYREKYLECQAAGDYTPFWAPFFEDYHARWPERELLFPDVPLNIDLTPEQKVVNATAVDARKKQLMHRFRNTFGNYTAKRKMKAQTTSSIEKMLACQSSLKGTRTLQPAEAYSKLYYKTRIKPVVDAEMKVLTREAGLSPITSDEEGDIGGDVKQSKKLRLSLVKKHTCALFTNETPEVKAEVADFVKKWTEDRKRSSSEDENISFTENIEKLPGVLADIFAGLAKQTGWTFSVLMGGPSPAMGGRIQILRSGPFMSTNKFTATDAAGKGIAGLPSPSPSESRSNSTLQPSEDAATTLSPMPSDSNTSLLPLMNQMTPFDDQQYDFFSGLHIPGPKSLFENDEPILPMPEGYTTPSTAQSLSGLELYDSTALDRMSMTDLFIAPLGPNWPNLPSNKPMPAVPPTFSYTQPPPPLMQPNIESPRPLTQTVLETPAVRLDLAMPMQPDIELPPPLTHSNVKLPRPLTETPARSALAVSPTPAISPALTVPTPAVSPALTVPTPTISTPAVSPTVMVQTPAVSTPAISPTVTVPTPAISPTITLPTPSVSSTPIPSVSPTVTLPTPSASPSPTPAPSPTFTVPKQLDVELPQPLTETPAVSTPAISPTLAVPIPAVSPTLMAPTQPELDIELTPPLTEPVLPIIDAPPVQQIESLAFGRSKRERKESTRNQVANSIGSLNIGKDNSTSKKRSKPLTHGVPAK